ncbi:MAG: YdcF family protein [Rickettsiales bacterium]|nr:YdcF family protein [Rickettsiales bacterium]
MKKILCSFVFLAALWASGLVWFAQKIPTAPLAEPPWADAIIVLTGGSGRLDYGMQLLAANRGKMLFISGVGANISVRDIIRQSSTETRRELTEAHYASIAIGPSAKNTIGNAEEIKQWLAGKPYKHLLVVTSNYHMPRSQSELQTMLPDMILTPAPVFSDEFDANHWLTDKSSRGLLLLEYHKYIASKLRHWFLLFAEKL